jgi:hypothetical protein
VRHSISRYLADEIDRHRAAGQRLLAVAPVQHHPAIRQALHELEALSCTYSESYLWQALGNPVSHLRAIEGLIRSRAMTNAGKDSAA